VGFTFARAASVLLLRQRIAQRELTGIATMSAGVMR
jgi:hypothetical protein